MVTKMNIDDSQENADFIKFRQVDIPGTGSIYDILDRVGVDYSGDNGAQEIVQFAESHPWVDNMNAETTWIIKQARNAVAAENKS